MKVMRAVIRTDLGFEFGKMLFKERLTRVDIERIFEITPGNLSRLLTGHTLTPKLVYILDILGYDIEVRFVRKGEQLKEGDL